MNSFQMQRQVPFTPQQMFALVGDIEAYPEFVPLCQSLRVRTRSVDADTGATTLVADMTVAYKMIRETFTSRIVMDPAALTVLVEYLDGPFRRMENRWRFHALESGGCNVDFDITYEFRSRMLGMLMGAMFDTAFRRFAEAFETRARQVYGVRRDPAVQPA